MGFFLFLLTKSHIYSCQAANWKNGDGSLTGVRIGYWCRINNFKSKTYYLRACGWQ